MTKTTNPYANFDMTKIFAEFDPKKLAADFSKLTEGMQVPNVDVDAIVKSQQKNLEALNAANLAATEGVKALAARQSEIMRETAEETKSAIEQLSAVKSPQEAAATQVELLKGSFEKALDNMRELADLVAKSNADSAEKINSRISESLDEIKDLTLKAGK